MENSTASDLQIKLKNIEDSGISHDAVIAVSC